MSHDQPSRVSRSRSRRRSRRAEGHHSAQNEAEQADRVSVPDDPRIPADKAEVIDDAASLDAFVNVIREAGCFGYDTEFIGEDSYHPSLCLLQLSTADRLAVIDPMQGLDITPIWELIADPAVETIVHAGGQDLEPVVRHLDRKPARIFDTQVVAGFVGLPYPLSLRQLVELTVGVRLGKALTFTRWDQRPLSSVHVRYAADDVRYLHAIRHNLGTQLAERDCTRWAEEECESLTDPTRYKFDPRARLERLVGNRYLTVRQRGRLYALLVFRDEAARAADLPPQVLVKDDVLIRVAKEAPSTPEALANTKGFPRPLVNEHGPEILARVEASVDLPSEQLGAPPLPLETPADRVGIDALWSLVSTFSRGRGIDPALVSSRREVARYYFVRDGRIKGDLPFAEGWRHELMGTTLDAVLRGDASVRTSWADGRLASVVEPGEG